MNQLISNVLMQRPTDVVELPERPLTLIEKLNDHKKTIMVLRGTEKQGSHEFIFLGHHLLGLQTAIDIVKQHSEWVSVHERFPPVEQPVLVYNHGSTRVLAFCNTNDGSKWLDEFGQDEFEADEIDFWQPLPQPPSEVQDDK